MSDSLVFNLPYSPQIIYADNRGSHPSNHGINSSQSSDSHIASPSLKGLRHWALHLGRGRMERQDIHKRPYGRPSS